MNLNKTANRLYMRLIKVYICTCISVTWYIPQRKINRHTRMSWANHAIIANQQHRPPAKHSKVSSRESFSSSNIVCDLFRLNKKLDFESLYIHLMRDHVIKKKTHYSICLFTNNLSNCYKKKILDPHYKFVYLKNVTNAFNEIQMRFYRDAHM